MRIFLLLFALAFATVGCEKIYHFDEDVDSQVVVGCFLNPDSVIRVDLRWSKKVDGDKKFKRVAGAQVTLIEDGSVLFESTSNGQQYVLWNYHPKAGSVYEIQVRHANLKEVVSARTTVPLPPTAVCNYTHTNSNSQYTFDFYCISDVNFDPATTGALLLTSWIGIDPADLVQYDIKEWEEGSVSAGNMSDEKREEHAEGFWTDAPYADQFNLFDDKSMGSAPGSTKCHEYVRLHPGNVARSFPLNFSVRDSEQNERRLLPKNWWFYPELYPEDELAAGYVVPEKLHISVMAASEDYDLYRKSHGVYVRNQNTNNYMALQNALFSAPSYRLHSNVKNGLGIFAAYNSVVFKFYYQSYEQ